MNQISIFEQAGMDIPEGLLNNRVKTIFKATGLDWVVEQKEVAVLEKFKPDGTYDEIVQKAENIIKEYVEE